MLWIKKVHDESQPHATEIEDLVRRYFSAMQKIAKTIFSPVGLLDSNLGLALGYDIEMMDTDAHGTSHRDRSIVLIPP